MNIKPGHKTTEFYVTMLFNIICVVLILVRPEEAESWIVILAALFQNVGYTVTRMVAKTNGK